MILQVPPHHPLVPRLAAVELHRFAPRLVEIIHRGRSIFGRSKGGGNSTLTLIGILEDLGRLLFQLPSGKLTYQWKTTISNRRYIFKWWISHCYVSFQGSTLPKTNILNPKSWFGGGWFFDDFPDFISGVIFRFQLLVLQGSNPWMKDTWLRTMVIVLIP